MLESWAEEVERLKDEIAARQARLSFLILGDQRKQVSMPIGPLFPEVGSREPDRIVDSD